MRISPRSLYLVQASVWVLLLASLVLARQRWSTLPLPPKDLFETVQNTSIAFAQETVFVVGGHVQRDSSEVCDLFSRQLFSFNGKEWTGSSDGLPPFVPVAGPNAASISVSAGQLVLLTFPFGSSFSNSTAPCIEHSSDAHTSSTLTAIVLALDSGGRPLGASGVNGTQWASLPPIPILDAVPDRYQDVVSTDLSRYSWREAAIATHSVLDPTLGEVSFVFAFGGLITKLNCSGPRWVEVPYVEVNTSKFFMMAFSWNSTSMEPVVVRQWTVIDIPTSPSPTGNEHNEGVAHFCSASMSLVARNRNILQVGNGSAVGWSLIVAGGRSHCPGMSMNSSAGNRTSTSNVSLVAVLDLTGIPVAATNSLPIITGVQAAWAVPRYFYISQEPPILRPNSTAPCGTSGQIFEMPGYAWGSAYLPYRRLGGYMVSSSAYFDGSGIPSVSGYTSPPLLLVMQVDEALLTRVCFSWPPRPTVAMSSCLVQVNVDGTKPSREAGVNGRPYPPASLRYPALTVMGTSILLFGGVDPDAGSESTSTLMEQSQPALGSVAIFEPATIGAIVASNSGLPTPAPTPTTPSDGSASASSNEAPSLPTFTLGENLTLIFQYCIDNMALKLSSNSLCSDNLLLDGASDSQDSFNGWRDGMYRQTGCGVANSGSGFVTVNTTKVKRTAEIGFVCYSQGTCPGRVRSSGAGNATSSPPVAPTRCIAGYLQTANNNEYNDPNCMWAGCCLSPVALAGSLADSSDPLLLPRPLCYNTILHQAPIPVDFSLNWYPAIASPFVIAPPPIPHPKQQQPEQLGIPLGISIGVAVVVVGLISFFARLQYLKRRARLEAGLKLSTKTGGYAEVPRNPVLMLLSEDRELRSAGFNFAEFDKFLRSSHHSAYGEKLVVTKLLGHGGSGTLFRAEWIGASASSTNKNTRSSVSLSLREGRFPVVLKSAMSLGLGEFLESQHELLTSMYIYETLGNDGNAIEILDVFFSQEDEGTVSPPTRSRSNRPVSLYPKFSCIITPYFEEGDLATWVRKWFGAPSSSAASAPDDRVEHSQQVLTFAPTPTVPIKIVLQIGVQLANFLIGIHSDQVALPQQHGQRSGTRSYFFVHRDFKPENVIVTQYKPGESISVRMHDFATAVGYDSSSFTPLLWRSIEPPEGETSKAIPIDSAIMSREMKSDRRLQHSVNGSDEGENERLLQADQVVHGTQGPEGDTGRCPYPQKLLYGETFRLSAMSESELAEPAFTMNYVPPEYVQQMRKRKGANQSSSVLSPGDRKKVLCAGDLWGLGCVLYAVCSKRCDAESARVMSTDARVKGFHAELVNEVSQQLGYPEEFAVLLGELLALDPAQRPSAVELKSKLVDLQTRFL
jgi:serine/threonine protein kinase